MEFWGFFGYEFVFFTLWLSVRLVAYASAMYHIPIPGNERVLARHMVFRCHQNIEKYRKMHLIHAEVLRNALCTPVEKNKDRKIDQEACLGT